MSRSPQESTSVAGRTPTAGQPEHRTHSDATSVKQGFESIFKEMKQAGAKDILPTAQQLQDAVRSGDHATIRRAFHDAIYDSFARMSEALPAIREFLRHKDRFVSLCAAEALLSAGDREGVPILTQLVNSSEAIPEAEQDLRVQAARLLAKFREVDAVPFIANLYSKTRVGDLLLALSTLNATAAEAREWPFVPSSAAIIDYGQTAEKRFIPQLRALFATTGNQELKNSSAWSLAKLTGEEVYVAYLAQVAQSGKSVNPKGLEKFDLSTQALRYLGSAESALATEVLERALQSDNPVAVQYAVVNLLFNKPERSRKATQVVLQELRGEQHRLGTELLLNVASKLDDPEIRSAGEAFDQRSGDRSWRLYAFERRQWPIYNWIDEYVIALGQSGK